MLEINLCSSCFTTQVFIVFSCLLLHDSYFLLFCNNFQLDFNLKLFLLFVIFKYWKKDLLFCIIFQSVIHRTTFNIQGSLIQSCYNISAKIDIELRSNKSSDCSQVNLSLDHNSSDWLTLSISWPFDSSLMTFLLLDYFIICNKIYISFQYNYPINMEFSGDPFSCTDCIQIL